MVNRQVVAVLTKEQQSVQELLAHPGWEIFEGLVRGKLKDQIQGKLQASARNGEPIGAATYAGQIDILEVVLREPRQYLQKG